MNEEKKIQSVARLLKKNATTLAKGLFIGADMIPEHVMVELRKQAKAYANGTSNPTAKLKFTGKNKKEDDVFAEATQLISKISEYVLGIPLLSAPQDRDDVYAAESKLEVTVKSKFGGQSMTDKDYFWNDQKHMSQAMKDLMEEDAQEKIKARAFERKRIEKLLARRE